MPSIYGSKSKGWQLRLDYTVKSQSIENNTSALDLTLYVYDGTGYSQNESANEAYYILQGTKKWNPYNYPSTGWYKLGVKSITVTHSGDGTGKVTLSGEWDCGFDSSYTPRHLTVSGSVTLPTIPRASSVSAANGTMGGNVAITITRKNSSFTHKLSYNAGSGYVSIATGVATSYTWASPDSMIDATTNASSRTVTIKCETYNGSSKIGESTTTCVLTVPESLVPSLSVVLSDAAGYQPTYGWVQNKSQLKAVATSGGVRGSTIVGTVMKIGNENANLNTGNLLTKSGSVVVTVTTTDSRGRSKTVTNTITVQQYAGPTIANLTYARGSYTSGVWTENNTAYQYIQTEGETDAVYLSPAGVDGTLSMGIYDMARLPQLPQLTADNVSALTVTAADGKSLSLTASEGVWLRSGQDVTQWSGKLTEALGQLTLLRCIDYRPSTGVAELCGLTEPAVTLTVTYRAIAGETELTLRVGAQRDGGYYATVNDDDTIYLLPEAPAEALAALAANGLNG